MSTLNIDTPIAIPNTDAPSLCKIPESPVATPNTNAPNFANYDFPEALTHTLLHMKYETPTPVQIKAIPLIGEGRDLLVSAQTGTGKTGAFGIPLVAKLLNSCNDSVLVLTPTRELASQVLSIFHQLLGKRSKINTALLIGGDHIGKQIRQLQSSPRVIVGTPGRVNDHIMRRTLKLHEIKYLVLDETDRMLDMGFDEQIEEIIRHISEDRQTLMFSATISNRIASLAKKYLNNAERVDCGASNTPAPKIKQENIHTSERAKYGILIQELEKREGSIIVFVKTKRDADELASKLRSEDHLADAIHGDLQQRRRERAVSDFRQKRYRIMVATDVASRGLDIPHIEHVINFNLPHCPEDYIHRIGRTARAGAEGSALNLISPEDAKKWNAIDRLLNPGAHRSERREQSSRGGIPNRGRSGGGRGQQRPYQNYGSSERSGGRGRSSAPYGSNGGSSYGGERSARGRAPYGGASNGAERERFASRGRAAPYGAPGGERGERGGQRSYAPAAYGSSNGGERAAPNRDGRTPSISYANSKTKKYGTSNGVSNTKGATRKSAPFFPKSKNAFDNSGPKTFKRIEE